MVLFAKEMPARPSASSRAALLLRATLVGTFTFILTLSAYICLGWLFSQIVALLH
jgi:hypothetical protein